MNHTITAVDLFAGGGGTSTGFVAAARQVSKSLKLTAINHDAKALATHQANFPEFQHILTEIQYVDPSEVVPEGRLSGMVASPSCTFFSRARGGKPIRPQDRASPWYLGKWTHKLDIPWVLIENVPEIIKWGPLNSSNQPIKNRAGEYFRLWKHMFRKQGYEFDFRILNSANYGDATTRKRFFAMARNDGKPIRWPEPTHGRTTTKGLKRWRSAREIIDWSIPGRSVFDRKRPLSPNTVRRIVAGLWKYSSYEMRPFIVLLEHSLLQPEKRVQDIDMPLPTITTAKGGAIALATPFLLPVEGIYRGNTAKSIDDPVGTITQRGYGGIVESFILSQASGGSPRSVSDPVPTIPTGGAHALVSAFLSEYHGGNPNRNSSVMAPVPTIDTQNRFALVEPYLIQYNGNSEVSGIEEPVPTIPTRDRFALVQPEMELNGTTYRLEVLYRMLSPHELSAAMGFPQNYRFMGTKQDTVKQIGNAVAVNMAKALILEALK